MVADSEKALATAEYWDKRYTNPEASEVERSWYRTFEQIWPFLSKRLPDPETNPRILHLGCGNSTLPADMALWGYNNHLSVDFSKVVIPQMQLKYPDFEWCVADVRNLEVCNDASVDVAIDKGTMDSMSYGSVWTPPEEVRESVRKYSDEVARVLRPAGKWLYMTFRQPHFVMPQLHDEGAWHIEDERLGEEQGSFDYFGYVMTKRCI